ncbi:MAG: hypothetical protein HYS07_01265 [Chlamydiae bacterium]|nr:hypothetical protein [Chlamydiota bacterium]
MVACFSPLLVDRVRVPAAAGGRRSGWSREAKTIRGDGGVKVYLQDILDAIERIHEGHRPH